MQQRQANPLNRSRTPERRVQVVPGPVRAASSFEVSLLGDDVADVEAGLNGVESRLAFAEADIDGLLAADVTHTSQISALQGVDATHTSQIATLQGQVATLGNGALKLTVRKITASATANATDYLILVDASAGAVVVTLPAVASGRTIAVKKIDATANAVSIASAANIDGAASQPVTPQYASFVVMCDGATWWIV